MVADAEGMLHFVLQFYFTDFVSVLELIEGLSDPDDVYKRKVKKGARLLRFIDARFSHSYTLALNQRLSRSPSDIVHSSDKLADLLGGNEPPIHLGRPGGVPAVIFNPALATLQQRLDHLEQVQVSRLEVRRAANYLRRAVKFYKVPRTSDGAQNTDCCLCCIFGQRRGSRQVDGCFQLLSQVTFAPFLTSF